jgi:hypothetical protein
LKCAGPGSPIHAYMDTHVDRLFLEGSKVADTQDPRPKQILWKRDERLRSQAHNLNPAVSPCLTSALQGSSGAPRGHAPLVIHAIVGRCEASLSLSGSFISSVGSLMMGTTGLSRNTQCRRLLASADCR